MEDWRVSMELGLEGHPEAVEAHPGDGGSPWSSGALEAQFRII
jgi:hypothetical protein